MKLNKPKKKLFKFIKCKLIVFYYQRIHSIFSDSLDKARMQFIAGIHDPNYSDLYKRYKTALDYVNRYSKIPQKIGNIKGEYLNIIEAARKQDTIIALSNENGSYSKKLWELGKDAQEKLEKLKSESIPEMSPEEEMEMFKKFIQGGIKSKQTK